MDRTEIFINYLSSSVEHINDEEIKSAWGKTASLSLEKLNEIKERNKQKDNNLIHGSAKNRAP